MPRPLLRQPPAVRLNLLTLLLANAFQKPVKEELKGDTDGDGIDDTRIKAQAAKLKAKRKKASDHEYWDVRLRTKLLEEMTLAAAAHRSFKQLAFDSATLIPFLLAQLKTLSRYRSYLLGADPGRWSYISSNEDVLLEDEVDRLYKVTIAIWGFLEWRPSRDRSALRRGPSYWRGIRPRRSRSSREVIDRSLTGRDPDLQQQ